MLSNTRRTLILAGVTALAFATYGFFNVNTGWETLSTSFMRNDRLYGGGDFRVKGNEVMSIKVAHPDVTFKPLSELKDPQQAEPTEAWMNDTDELLNRTTVAFFRGTVDGGMKRYFQQFGQGAAWWYTKDWRTQYVATAWIDYKAPTDEHNNAPKTTRLLKTSDGGKEWTQLQWPAAQGINQLLFLDAQRGYAVGERLGIWRTVDGGQSWHVVTPPAGAVTSARPNQQFNAVNLGPDGVLRVAYTVAQASSVQSFVERLDWGKEVFTRDAQLPGQTIARLEASPDSATDYSLYALALLDTTQSNGQDGQTRPKRERIGVISTWTKTHPEAVTRLHTFDAGLMLDGLSVGTHGVLLVYATDPNTKNGGGAPIDLTFSSTDAGRNWTKTRDQTAQGGYFDPQDNTLYSLFAYTLKKRQF